MADKAKQVTQDPVFSKYFDTVTNLNKKTAMSQPTPDETEELDYVLNNFDHVRQVVVGK